MPRWMKVLVIIAAVIAFLYFFGKQMAYFYTEYLWFAQLGYASVFMKQYFAKAIVGVGAWLLFVIIVYANVLIAKKLSGVGKLRADVQQAVGQKFADLLRRGLGWLLLLAAAAVGVVLAIQAAKYWDTILKFFYAVPFTSEQGKPLTDPIFGKNVGDYVFKLPFWQLFYRYLLIALAAAAVATVLVYALTAAIDLVVQRRHFYVASYVKVHLSVLLSLLLLTKAWGYRLDMFLLLFGKMPGEAVWGAGWTDVHTRLPVLYVLMFAAIGASVLLLVNIRFRTLKLMAGVVLVLIAASLLTGSALPRFVQKFIVKPNELEYEKRYLAHNIRMTRKAYGLDKVQEIPFDEVKPHIDQATLERHADTVENIRLWDYRPQRETYAQLQEIRTYYDFFDVDVDRYELDGSPRQVTLSAREINYEQLPQRNPTWIQRHLYYTHGYGVCLSPVNEISGQGMPRFFVKDIPPRVALKRLKGELSIERAGIYHGELTTNYVIVKTRQRELDYPKVKKRGEDVQTCIYKGSGGVPCGSFIRRLAFALRFGDLEILLPSAPLTRESRIMFRRVITERAQRLAPFLLYDRDPYIVISDTDGNGNGELYWMLDAYTTTDLFPYSAPYHEHIVEMQRTRPDVPSLFPKHRFNYIRNSVKVVIDAYNGTTTFYVADKNDSLIKVYARIFPKLFLKSVGRASSPASGRTPELRTLDDMPKQLQKHIRYPLDLFTVQAEMYALYHMRKPEVFYQKEDIWDISTELYDQEEQPVEPYYVNMRLPRVGKRLEFALILPFTPAKKQIMRAWMCARCDGQHYGKLLTYVFPPNTTTHGTMQVEARINQDTEISQLLTLWGQKGSQVIRGNLLVIPIEHSLLYVEPLYLRSEKGELPQLQQVIAATQDKLAMAPTLQEALRKLIGDHAGETAPTKLGAVVEELWQALEKADQSARQGQFAEFGKALEKAKELAAQLRQKVGAQ